MQMKRFTFDIDIDLHTRIKVACAETGTQMADRIRSILEEEFGDDPGKPRSTGPTEKYGFRLPSDLVERVRRAVYWTPGETMTGVTQSALTAYLDRLERRRGEPFPDRSESLPTGRPMKPEPEPLPEPAPVVEVAAPPAPKPVLMSDRAYDSALAIVRSRDQPIVWRDLVEAIRAATGCGETTAHAAIRKMDAAKNGSVVKNLKGRVIRERDGKGRILRTVSIAESDRICTMVIGSRKNVAKRELVSALMAAGMSESAAYARISRFAGVLRLSKGHVIVRSRAIAEIDSLIAAASEGR